MYDSSLSDAYATLALAYFNRKQLREGEEAAGKATELDPGNFNAHWVLGRIYQTMGRDLEAVEMFRKVLRANADYYAAYSFIRNSLNRLGDTPQIAECLQGELQMYERYIPQHPEEATAHVFYATALAQAGRREEALQMGSKARELNPDDPLMLYNLACLFAILGEKEKTIEALGQSVGAGFIYHEWLARDADLDSVRGMPEFTELMDRITRVDHNRS